MLPSAFSYVKASKKCVTLLDKCKTISQIKQIQSHLTITGTLKDPYAAAKIISFCSITHLSHAYKLFLRLPHKSTFIWNTMMRAFLQKKEPHKAISLYKHMLRSGLFANNYTFSFLIRACTHIINIPLALNCHAQIIKLNWESYDFILNGLVHLYSTCGCMGSARRLFDLSLIKDVITWTALINGYLKWGQILEARELFDEMPEQNSVTWNAMVSGYSQTGLCKYAMEIFNAMLGSGFRPNHAGIVGALTACASLGTLEQGRWIHAFVERNDVEVDGVMGAALIDMYAKCGCVEMAWRLFDDLPSRDVYAFTCLISGLANHGQGAAALELFGRMRNEGVVPNDVTFVCVLNACSQMGLVEEGLRIFRDMSGVHGIWPGVQHYGCVVDLLGRAGKLEEAERVVREMPMEPDSYVLGALLNACRVHGDLDLGKEMVERLVRHGLDRSGAHVLLSNMYASVRKWDDVEKVRKGMDNKKARKVPGCSLIEVDGTVCEFVAGDRSYVLMEEIMNLSHGMERHLNAVPLDYDGNEYHNDM